MARQIFDALMLTRKSDQARFVQVMCAAKVERAKPLEFSIAEVSRLPWADMGTSADGSRHFHAEIKGEQMLLVLEPYANGFVVRSLERLVCGGTN